MKILEIFVALLFAKISLIWCQECNTPIIRDIVNPDDSKRTDFLIQLWGSIVPLLNGSEALELRHLGSSNSFNIPLFKLSNSEDYYITAIDLQFGDVGSCQGTGDVIVIDKIRIGASLTEISNPRVLVTYDDRNGYLNLTELGNPNNGRIIRLKIPATRGNVVSYQIITTSPAGSNTEQIRLCLRTEIYGCLVSSVTTAPNIVRDLLQYNLVEPTIYSDSKYTGVVSQGYLSGGQGILNDGILGRFLSTDPSDWLGWSNPDVSNPEILFLFTARRVIQNISIFYFTEYGTLNGVEFYGENGLVSGLSETTESDGLVYRGIYSHRGLAAGYLRVKLMGTNPLIITEIEVIQSDGTNLLGPVLDTSRFTVPSSVTSTQTTSAIIPTTISPSVITVSTRHTNATPTTTTQTLISTSETNASPEITTTTPIGSTQSTTQTINTTNDTVPQFAEHILIPVIIGISLPLFLSICLNIALVLLLLVCYSRYYRTAVRVRREERDQGDYVPMAPVEMKNYENVSSKSGIKESATQQQKGDTKDQHYYSKIGSEYVATT